MTAQNEDNEECPLLVANTSVSNGCDGRPSDLLSEQAPDVPSNVRTAKILSTTSHNHDRNDNFPTQASGVIDIIGSSSRGHLALSLGVTNKDHLPLRQENDIEFYKKPDPSTISFPFHEIKSRWEYQLEDGCFEAVPKGVTKWMLTWLFDRDLIPPTFAPVADWEMKVLSAEKSSRGSKKRNDIRQLCAGYFRAHADFVKSFICSWKHADRHQCSATLYVALCANNAFSNHAKSPLSTSANVDVQCVWSSGCEHHKDDKDRGIVRSSQRSKLHENAITPRGVCHKSIQQSGAMALAAGNRSFGYTNISTARHGQYVERKRMFRKHDNPIANLATLAKQLAELDSKEDPFRHWKFHGCIHDIGIMSSGDISSVSIYSPLSIDIISKELKVNEKTVVVIDCSGGLVSDVWISTASEMARRSLSGKAKEAKKKSPDESMLLFDTLVFHLAISLPSGPFVGLEAVVVERTGRVFENILRGFKNRLSLYTASPATGDRSIPFFVTDTSTPFAYAVNRVFNHMDVPSYMAVLIWSAKKGLQSIRKREVNSI